MNEKNNIIQGIKFWFKGAFFVLKNFSLWKYLLMPLIINFVIISCLFYFGWEYVSDKLPDKSFISPVDKQGIFFLLFWIKAASVYTFQFLLQIIVFIISFLVFLLTYIFTTTIIGSPFYDLLSSKIEQLYNINAEEFPFSLKKNNHYHNTENGYFFAFELDPCNWQYLVCNMHKFSACNQPDHLFHRTQVMEIQKCH